MIKQQIMKLLAWDELQYGKYQEASGIAYLHKYIPNDTWGIEGLTLNPMFWAWWRNHWEIRDRQFVEDFKEETSKKYLLVMYKATHQIESLVNEVYPNAKIMGSSYARMIGKINDAK